MAGCAATLLCNTRYLDPFTGGLPRCRFPIAMYRDTCADHTSAVYQRARGHPMNYACRRTVRSCPANAQGADEGGAIAGAEAVDPL